MRIDHLLKRPSPVREANPGIPGNVERFVAVIALQGVDVATPLDQANDFAAIVGIGPPFGLSNVDGAVIGEFDQKVGVEAADAPFGILVFYVFLA
jgi:hypothetical protein